MQMYSKKVWQSILLLKSMLDENITSLLPVKCFESDFKEIGSPLPDVTNDWFEVGEADYIGGNEQHYWIYKKFKTPSKIEGKELLLKLRTAGGQNPWAAHNPQGMLYLNGKLTEGLDLHHTTCDLEYDKDYEMYIYLDCGTESDRYEFHADLAICDTAVKSLYYDLKVPYDAAMCFDEKDTDYLRIMKHLDIATNILDIRQVGNDAFYESVKEAKEYLDKEFYANLLEKNSDLNVSCIGHTHIDVAYLWTFAQTREKVQRSFSTVLQLMDKYPEYKFMSSQPQLYQYMKEEAPDVYEKVKEMVAQNRWEVEGGMWVESDCNLTSGESLIRQFLHGKRFFKDEFGKDSNVLWLPDVFGYSAAMPQILKKCGVDKFATSKISWNEFNKFPYDAFMWQGIDGSEVFTYFLSGQDVKKPGENDTETVYNGDISPSFALGAWRRFQQKEFVSDALIPFGYGDGGGGSTEEMLETERRLSAGLPGIPKTKQIFVKDFLDMVEKEFTENCEKLRRVPRWVGELYLEIHRATYTNIARIKKQNRLCEFLYHNLEAASVLDFVLTNGKYEKELINEMWKKILTNQFHDILPGSSRIEVYADTDKIYDELFSEGNEILEKKLDSISSLISEKGQLIFNPNGFDVTDTVCFGGKTVVVRDIPAYGWKVVGNILPSEKKISVTDNKIENDYFIVLFNEYGKITSIFDKRCSREVLRGGYVEIKAFEDRPYAFKAWDFSPYINEKQYEINHVISIDKLDEGDRAGLCIKWKFFNSTITQKIYLYSELDRIDFDTTVDWQEKRILLKALFPINVNANKCTYEIQFGNIERENHTNTSWQRAKFEVCAQKWMDISDGGYGVSLLNDCKYGHSADGNVIMMSLLRSAENPLGDHKGVNSDIGMHTFKYSLIPHEGDYRSAGVVKKAYSFNNPLILRENVGGGKHLPSEFSMVSTDCKNIIIDTVKQAEDNEDIIVRAYDAHNMQSKAKLNFGFDVKKAFVCDMLENNISEIAVDNNSLEVMIKNFEVVTLRLCK